MRNFCRMMVVLMLGLMIFFSIPQSASASPVYTYITNTSSADNAITYTFSGVSLGAESSDRYILVGTATRRAGTDPIEIVSASIAGVSATVYAESANVVAASQYTGFFIAHVPTGTTGDITVTFDGTMLRAGIVVYALTGIDPVPYNAVTAETNDPHGYVSAPAGGFVIGLSTSGSPLTTDTWTTLTERFAGSVGAESLRWTGADATFAGEASFALTGVTYSNDLEDTLSLLSFGESLVDPSIIPIGLLSDTTDATTYTIAGQYLGEAQSDRYIIFSIAARKANTETALTSVTVGGVTATTTVYGNNTQETTPGNFANNFAAIGIVNVPTGQVGDVVVTFPNTMVRAVVSVYRATGLSTTTPYDLRVSTSTSPSVNLDIPANGLTVASALDQTITTILWTGITERFDEVLESVTTMSSAMDKLSEETGRTITATFGSGGGFPVGVFASFAPIADAVVPIVPQIIFWN